ncbi:TPA: hypothetical protein ACX6RY_003363 [Photobacterium damselae]
MMLKNKLYAILSAVMPGGYRLIAIYMLNVLLLAAENSLVVSQFVLVTGLCMFSSLGLSTSYIKQAGGGELHTHTNSVYMTHVASLLLISLCVALTSVMFQLVPIESAAVFTFALFAIGAYQLERHYYLAKNQLDKLFQLDCLLVVITAISFAIWSNSNGLLLIAGANGVAVLISTLLSRRYTIKNVQWYDPQTLIMGVKLGYSNLVSGGVMYILPTLMLTVANDRLVSMLSMVVAISGAVLVLPRAVFNTKIQKIASDARDGQVDNSFYAKTNKQIGLICILSLPAILLLSLIYLYINGYHIMNEAPLMLGVITIMLLVLIVGQLSLVDSMLVIFLNKENAALKYNTITFVAMMLCYVGFSVFKVSSDYAIISMMAIISLMLICYVVRLYKFKKIINQLRG